MNIVMNIVMHGDKCRDKQGNKSVYGEEFMRELPAGEIHKSPSILEALLKRFFLNAVFNKVTIEKETFRRVALVIAIVGVIKPIDVLAEISAPFVSANRNPFVQIYGLPSPHSAHQLSASTYRLSWQLEAVSSFSFDNYQRQSQPQNTQQDSVILDGETYRNSIRIEYGYTDTVELGILVPYIAHSGGELDGFIDNWHGFFGLPDGDRSDFAQDRLEYHFQSNDDFFTLNKPTQGLGDLTLDLGYLLSESDTRKIMLRSGVKLPTGNSKRLLGSGSTDIFAGINISDQKKSGFRWHLTGGLLWLGQTDTLKDQRKNWVACSSSTISWPLNERISLKGQIDMHSAFYNSTTSELGSASAQLIVGGAIRIKKNWLLNLSLSEDIAVDTAPDVVFQVGLSFEHR